MGTVGRVFGHIGHLRLPRALIQPVPEFFDGGVFATKPYICGSNYLLKMSDYRRGEWCDIVDGLYWRFVGEHLEFFGSNPRLALMTSAFQKLDGDRKSRIFGAAESFLDGFTC